MVGVILGSLIAASLLSARRGMLMRTSERLAGILGGSPARIPENVVGGSSTARASAARWLSSHPKAIALGAALIGGFVVGRLAGPIGVPLGAVLGAAVPWSLHRRTGRRRAEALERQLAELVETVALGVRSGLALSRALTFAAAEAGLPISEVLERMTAEQALGTPLEVALGHFAESLSTDDARLFVSVLTVHAKSGGNLAGALDEVTSTIRHRIAVRRELRALSAQGRISGAVLGSLPIAFFLVLASTSHRELAPVYRSAPGVGMVAGGLVMQALAYIWIRRLMRVHI
jgi:tight adherence protein B